MTIEIPHTLPKEEAKKRITSLLDNVKQDFGGQINNLQENWQQDTGNFSFSAMGNPVSGTIEVRDKIIALDIKLPFLLQLYSGKIKSVIEQEARRSLQ